jgi:hypothetical protein
MTTEGWAAASAHPEIDRQHFVLGGTRYLQRMVKVTALIAGPLFLITVILHPARDGQSIAADADWYALTHAMEAVSLLLQAMCLAGVIGLSARWLGSRGLPALTIALIGTMWWFGLIIFDGAHNPATARYAPQIVHTAADLDVGGAIVILMANVLFPLGCALLGIWLHSLGARWIGLLLGLGGVIYSVGGTATIFGYGPYSPVTSVIETFGAAPYAVGYVLLGRLLGGARYRPRARRPDRSMSR